MSMIMSHMDAKSAFEKQYPDYKVNRMYELDSQRYLVLVTAEKDPPSSPFFVIYKGSGRVVNYLPSANLELYKEAVDKRRLI